MIQGKRKKPSQRDLMRTYFQVRPYQPIPVYELSAIALQYNARINELRKEGMCIPEPEEKRVNGQRHTYYTYLPDGQRRLF